MHNVAHGHGQLVRMGMVSMSTWAWPAWSYRSRLIPLSALHSLLHVIHPSAHMHPFQIAYWYLFPNNVG